MEENLEKFRRVFFFSGFGIYVVCSSGIYIYIIIIIVRST
jgi:hypothetical protein